MINQFSRTELIIGKNNIERINKSKVVLFGLGGVGSYVLEGLARAGVGHFILVDDITGVKQVILLILITMLCLIL